MWTRSPFHAIRPLIGYGRRGTYCETGPPMALIADRARNLRRVGGIAGEMARATGLDEAHVRSRLHWVEHHPAHLASTLLRVALRRGGGLCDRRLRRLREHVGRARRGTDARPCSIASTSRIRSACSTLRSPSSWGSRDYGDEFKVMGLAPYGEPRRVEPASSAGSSRAGRRLQARPLVLPPLSRTASK